MARTVEDQYHIIKSTFVKYTTNKDSNEYYKMIIKEDPTELRFEELFSDFKHSFDYAAKAYIKNIQSNKAKFSGIPYFNGNELSMEKITIDFDKDIEHCYGLPFKRRTNTKHLIKTLVNEYKKCLSNKNIIKEFNITDEEKYTLKNLDKTLEDLKNFRTQNDNTFSIQINSINDKLKLLQEKYKDNYEVQNELIFHIIRLRKFMNIQNKVFYSNRENLEKFYNDKFIDEASNIVIRNLARSPQELNILNLKNINNGTTELSRLVRLNLSSFGINLNREEAYINLLNKEKAIKNKVIDKLTTKYLNDVIKDEEVEEYINDLFIIDVVSGKKVLSDDFIKNNINRNTIKDFTGYDLNKIVELVKPIEETKTKEEINDNINSLLAVWNELDRIENTNINFDELSIAKELVDYNFINMLASKDYQIELAKRSLFEITRNKMAYEINDCLNKYTNYSKGIRKYQLLNNLYGTNLNNNAITDLCKELNESDYISTENKLTDLELEARKNIFAKDCIEMDINDLYNKYDMVEMLYYLTADENVKKKLKQDYLQGLYTINYKKVAYKSDTMAEIGQIGEYSPIIRRVKEKVKLQDDTELYPSDNYLNNKNATISDINHNNLYMIELPINKKTSNFIYIGYENNEFKLRNVLRNVELDVDNSNNYIVKAEIQDESNYLATKVPINSPKFAVIESSPRFQIGIPEKVENKFYENLKSAHISRFISFDDTNTINNIQNETNHLNYNNQKNNSERNSNIYKRFDLSSDTFIEKENEINSMLYNNLESTHITNNNELNEMFKNEINIKNNFQQTKSNNYNKKL